MQFFCKYIFVRTVLTDLLHSFVMSIIVSNCQHCDEQQFRTLSCVHYTIFSVVKSNIFIRALLLARLHSCYGKTTRTLLVHLVVLEIMFGFAYANSVASDCACKF